MLHVIVNGDMKKSCLSLSKASARVKNLHQGLGQLGTAWPRVGSLTSKRPKVQAYKASRAGNDE